LLTPAVPSEVGATAAQADGVTKAAVPAAGATEGSGAATRCYTIAARPLYDEALSRAEHSTRHLACCLAQMLVDVGSERFADLPIAFVQRFIECLDIRMHRHSLVGSHGL